MRNFRFLIVYRTITKEYLLISFAQIIQYAKIYSEPVFYIDHYFLVGAVDAAGKAGAKENTDHAGD